MSPHERTRDVGAAPDEAALGVGGVPGGRAKRINWGKSGDGKLDGRTSIVQRMLVARAVTALGRNRKKGVAP